MVDQPSLIGRAENAAGDVIVELIDEQAADDQPGETIMKAAERQGIELAPDVMSSDGHACLPKDIFVRAPVSCQHFPGL